MMKHIKQGENIGVAKQVQGAVVDVYPHPRFKRYGWKCFNKTSGMVEKK